MTGIVRIETSPERAREGGPRRPSRRLVLTGFGTGLVLAGNWASVAASPRLRFSTAFGPPIHADDGSGFFNRLMAEACGRLGYRIEVDAPPAERALVNANAGIVDGDGPRIPNLGDIGDYPNLLRVPVELIDVDFVAFTRGEPLEAAGWAALAPYNVGIVRGWKILEQNVIGARSLVRTKTAALLFGLLANDRIDVAVIDRLSGLAAARAVGIRDICVSQRPLARRPMYLHLHNRHAGLVEPLARVLTEMKADGSFARIEQATLGPYLDAGTSAGERR